MLCDVNVATEILGNRTKYQTYGQVASKHIPDHVIKRIGRTLRFKEQELREWVEQDGPAQKEGDERETSTTNQ